MSLLGYLVPRIAANDEEPAATQAFAHLPNAATGVAEAFVERLNRMISGWANYFALCQVSPAYAAVDTYAAQRLRQWFCRKHKVKSGKHVRFFNRRLWEKCGLMRLALTTRHFPWAKA